MCRHLQIILLVTVMLWAYANATDGKCYRPHEAWHICGSFCARTCAIPNPACPKIACSSNTAGCRCIKGYLRTRDNDCVLPCHCPR